MLAEVTNDELSADADRRITERTCLSNYRSIGQPNGSSWPGPEILAINLIAENPPLDPPGTRNFDVTATGGLWPGCASAGINLLAEYRPFNSIARRPTSRN